MAHGPAKFTQSDINRIFKAAKKTGVNVQVEFRPDGTMVATTSRLGPNGEMIETNEWDEAFNGAAKAEIR